MYERDDDAIASPWLRLPEPGQVSVVAEFFRMLADPTRLKVLWLLCGAEFDVTTLAARVGIARPAVSQHLSKLRLAGLVSTHREGRRAVYRAQGGYVPRLLREAIQAAEHSAGLLRHHERATEDAAADPERDR